MEKIQDYRQPMVTAAGIFLGFMLNFTGTWVHDAFSKNPFKDTVVGISIIVCIALLQIVLFRILRMNYPENTAKEYYRRTLRLFLIAVSVPFVSFLVLIIQKFVNQVINADGG